MGVVGKIIMINKKAIIGVLMWEILIEIHYRMNKIDKRMRIEYNGVAYL